MPGETCPIGAAGHRLAKGSAPLPDEDTIAADLINWHFKVQPGLVREYRVTNEDEADPKGPINLIEVNAHTAATGTTGSRPRDVPFPTLIAEVTAAASRCRRGRIGRWPTAGSFGLDDVRGASAAC